METLVELVERHMGIGVMPKGVRGVAVVVMRVDVVVVVCACGGESVFQSVKVLFVSKANPHTVIWRDTSCASPLTISTLNHLRTRPDAEAAQVLVLLHPDAEALWW